jgi:hypothetical protein
MVFSPDVIVLGWLAANYEGGRSMAIAQAGSKRSWQKGLRAFRFPALTR